jgi:hypothetical protein
MVTFRQGDFGSFGKAVSADQVALVLSRLPRDTIAKTGERDDAHSNPAVGPWGKTGRLDEGSHQRPRSVP